METTYNSIPLSFLNEGEEGIIMALTGGRELSGRLAGLGISLNVRIRVLRGGSGLMMVQVGGTRVALGAGEAEKIMVSRVEAPVCDLEEEPRKTKQLLIALTGQPNVGKSTVFNILTGLSQHVGNWPGKTVEKKEGAHICGDVEMRIVDLPGTYSLTSFSEEERVARDFILTEHPDIIVLLVNAAALERSLYLLTELLLLGPPVIVAVNMIDVAEQQGIRVNINALERSLGVPVVEMTASKNRGIRELVDRILAFSNGDGFYSPRLPEVAADHREVFQHIQDLLGRSLAPADAGAPQDLPARWLATKVMEGDPEISSIVETRLPAVVWNTIQTTLVKHEDSLHAVVGGRYDWIEEATRASISRFRMGQVVMTDRLDHILTRPLFGIPILLAIFALVFGITYEIGSPMQEWLEDTITLFARQLEPWLSFFPGWLRGLIIDGIIGGAGSVLTFLPILLIFFAALAVLEDVGYMARAAFVMDRFMHLIGLHGKSVIPLCLGFGCNVPSVLGARIVESRKERLLTIFLSPFIPCNARLAVLTFITAAVFGAKAGWISASLLAVNLLILGFTGMIANRFFLREESMPFIMELPLYHKPDPRTIGITIWIRTIAFVKRAGTVIIAVSALVWLFSYLPHGRVEDSFLAMLGKILEPVGRPMGLDWKMMTALLTSIIAKENAVATLGVLYGVGRDGLVRTLAQAVSPASALAFLVVLMLFIPCAATIAVMKREMGNWRWFMASFGLMLITSCIGGILAYHLALRLGW